jgi:phosphoribosylformylglycinamidine (FGAM) synthase-like amidotransferase family enzyme
MKINVAVMSGYGINCEMETQFAFELAGANSGTNVKTKRIHINDLIEGKDILGNSVSLEEYDILAFPGGFSYGDDTGSGNAYAKKVKDNIWKDIQKFIGSDKLVIGICNGCQIGSILGVAPALNGEYGKHQVDFRHNESVQYENRWVLLQNVSSKSIFTEGIEYLPVPVRHGEGRFDADPRVLDKIENNGLVAFKYVKPDYSPAGRKFPYNPNSSLNDVAGITDETGRILIMMPHPEAAVRFTHLPNWLKLRQEMLRKGQEIPKYGPGLKIFENAVNYFK